MFVDPVGVVHFLDGFLAPDLRHVQKIPKEAVMRPILVMAVSSCRRAVFEIFDDLYVALHDALRRLDIWIIAVLIEIIRRNQP